MEGGSFAISNGGVFGSMMGAPIINLPQTAVLGIHAIKDRAVVVDGKIEIRQVSLLRISCPVPRTLTDKDDVSRIDI